MSEYRKQIMFGVALAAIASLTLGVVIFELSPNTSTGSLSESCSNHYTNGLNATFAGDNEAVVPVLSVGSNTTVSICVSYTIQGQEGFSYPLQFDLQLEDSHSGLPISDINYIFTANPQSMVLSFPTNDSVHSITVLYSLRVDTIGSYYLSYTRDCAQFLPLSVGNGKQSINSTSFPNATEFSLPYYYLNQNHTIIRTRTGSCSLYSPLNHGVIVGTTGVAVSYIDVPDYSNYSS